MRGSILVTFDENLNGRGTQNYSISVNSFSRDLHYTDVTNLYSTYVFSGDTVVFTVDRNSYLYKSEVLIKRLDYTTDDENGDRGVKETIINPVITYTSTTSIYTFTATTISAAYDFYYVIECTTSFCYDNSLGFTGGTDPSVTDIDILSTGKLIVSGEYTTYRGTSANRVVQLNDDGTIYTGFTYGSGFTPDTTNQVAELSNGKLIFVGQFSNYNGTSCTKIIGLNADGTVYTGFTTGTGFNGDPTPIERQTDDKVIVGGRFWTYNGTTSPKIVRINTDGTIDNTFVVGSGFTSGGTYTDINVEVSCLAIQSDGKIIVGGTFDAYRGTSANRLVRINTNGSYDTSFSGVTTGFNSLPVSIKIQPDGKILIGGYFTTYNGTTRNRLVRLNTDGSYDTSFSGFTTGFNAEVLAIELTYNDIILCGGSFFTINGSARSRLAALNSDGSVLGTSAFFTGINNRVDSLAVLPDGDIYVGGIFTNVQGISVQRFARLGRNGLIYSCQETTPTPTPTMTPTMTLTPTITPTVTPTVTPVIPYSCLDIGTGFTGTVYDIALQNDGKILNVGNFTGYSSNSVERIARLNTDGLIDTSFSGVTSMPVFATTVVLNSVGKIFLGGAFSLFNGGSANRIVGLNSDGTKNTSFDYGIGFSGSNVGSIAIQSDDKVVVGGDIYKYKGINIPYGIIRLNIDGSVDSSFIVAGFDNPVNDIEIQSDNKLLVGGQFTSYGATSKNRLIRLNSNGTNDVLFNIGTGFQGGPSNLGNVESIAVQSDNKIVVGGHFITFNGNSFNGIVRLNSDGSLDSSFSVGTGFNNPVVGVPHIVYSVVIQPNGKILVGGRFASYNGTTANNIIRLNSDGSVDGTFTYGTGFNDTVRRIKLDSDNKILVGGSFTSYNGTTANRIIRLNSDGTENICP